MSLKLDPRILKRNLPPDIHPTMNQVSSNVAVAVDEVFGRFEAALDQELQNIEAGRYSADLQRQLDAIQQSYARAFDGLSGELRRIQDAAAAAKTAALVAGAAAATVAKQLEPLQTAVDELTSKMAQARAEVQSLGKKTAGALATFTYKALKGALL